MTKLYELIEKAKHGDNEILLYFIEKFNPTINKFSKQLKYEEAETDLIIKLIQIIQSINLAKFKDRDNGEIFNYIYMCLKNKKINLFKNQSKNSITQVNMDLDMMEDSKEFEIENKLLIEKLLSTLTEHQRMILINIYFKGYTAIEIANKLNISRQAINSTKKKALRKLKKQLNSSF